MQVCDLNEVVITGELHRDSKFDLLGSRPRGAPPSHLNRPHKLTRLLFPDLINNLYNPQLTRSTSSAKRLISPQLALEFPFLPPTQSSTRSPQPASGTASLPRHSPSAQALALFRFPGLIVSHFPGSTWTMSVVSVSKEKDTVESGALAGCHWRAELEWTLECEVKVPMAGEKRFGQVARRTVELEFGESDKSQEQREAEVEAGMMDRVPSSGSSSSQEHIKHSSWGSTQSIVQPEVVLVKVK